MGADAVFLGRMGPELELLLPMLDERSRRLVLGAVARAAGEDGRGAVASLTGASWQTVADGAAEVASGEVDGSVTVEATDVRRLLGRVRFEPEVAATTTVPGVVTGLAVTGAGGDVLHVEASVSDGPDGLNITGQLGEVMRESAEIALSYVRSHARDLGIDSRAFAQQRFHVHVPAGSVPKDGPSAGITITTALVSLLTGRAVRPVVAMTGEVTLQGRVLPIGGVKQKVLAAHRAGITEVVLPERNRGDLEDLPADVLAEVEFHLASSITEVLEAALEPAAQAPLRATA